LTEIIRVTTLEELDNILDLNDRVVVKFGAEWCIPCRRLEPHLTLAANKSTATFVTVDVDEADDALRQAYPIQSVPYVAYLEKGIKVREITGRTGLLILKEIEEI
jgi:thioredoxin 1